MPAFKVINHKEPQFVAFYQRLIANGKTKMQAYVAIQKKLLVLIYTLWKNDEEYKRKGEIQSTSSDKEPKPLSGVGFDRILKKEVASQKEATQDELPCNKSPEALSGVRQI